MINLFNSSWLKGFLLVAYTGALISFGYKEGAKDERNSQEAKQKVVIIKNLQEKINELETRHNADLSIITTLNTKDQNFYEGLKDENNSLAGELDTCYLSNKQLRIIQRARSGNATKMSDAKSTESVTGTSATNATHLLNHHIDLWSWAHECYIRVEAWEKGYYYGNGGKGK